MFTQFKQAVQRQFNEMQNHGTIYRSNIDKDYLWNLYLKSFPEGSNPIFRERTKHDCQCCKSFIRNAGTMLSICNNKLISIWDIQIGGIYQIVADELSKAVKKASIQSV